MNNLDNIGQTFQWAGQRYMAIMQPFAEKIFFGLVLIEIVITCVHFLTDQDETTRLLAELFKKSLALGFLYAMIVNAPIWFSAIILGFQQIGGQAAGIPSLSPSSAFNSGLALFQIIYRGFGSLGWFHVTLAALIALIAGLIMFLSFALIAGQMLLALCEAYVGAGGGVLLLGFSGSRWTTKFAEGFLGWIVGVGIKCFSYI
jgi:type IV secretion system protein TrbL